MSTEQTSLQKVPAPRLFGELTFKQSSFCDHYLRTRNATESARLAGYSGDENGLAVAAHYTLRNSKVQAELRRRLKKHILSADQVLEGLSNHAKADLANILEPDGSFNISSAKKRGVSNLLKKLKVKKRIERDSDGNETEFIDHEFEIHDAQSALKTLAQYHGLLIDRIETVSTIINVERQELTVILRESLSSAALDLPDVDVDGEVVE